jgi:RNA polymerase sporulation-specific sigma factor
MARMGITAGDLDLEEPHVSTGRRRPSSVASRVETASEPDPATRSHVAQLLENITHQPELGALVEEARYDVATDEELIRKHREGDLRSADILLSRYRNFARMKARSYFLVGAERDDILQESLIGLYKAIRDFQPERQTSFRAFADVCITRQLITAIRSARCQKHQPLNSYLSLSKPLAAEEEPDRVLMDVLTGPAMLDPAEVVIAAEELGDIKAAFDRLLSQFETEVLRLYADGKSYHQIAALLEREVKSIDNALQRIKRKIEGYLRARDSETAGPTPLRRMKANRLHQVVPPRRAASVS